MSRNRVAKQRILTQTFDRMTLREYGARVLILVKEADNASAAESVIANARKVIESSAVRKQSEREFWVDLYEAIDSEHEKQVDFSKRAAQKWPFDLGEAQSADALRAVIAAAKGSVGQLVEGR